MRVHSATKLLLRHQGAAFVHTQCSGFHQPNAESSSHLDTSHQFTQTPFIKNTNCCDQSQARLRTPTEYLPRSTHQRTRNKHRCSARLCLSDCRSSFVVRRSSVRRFVVRRFVVRRSSFVVRRSSFVVRRSSFVARRSSFVGRRSSLVARRSSLVARRSSLVGRWSLVVESAGKSRQFDDCVKWSLVIGRRSSLVARWSSLVGRRSLVVARWSLVVVRWWLVVSLVV